MPDPPESDEPETHTPETHKPDIMIVAGTFRARTGREADLAAVLSRYVVLTRSVTGCRNVDLAAEASGSGCFLVVEKWVDADAQRAHLDSEHMVTMARTATDLLAAPPELALYASISAHDLE